MPDLKAVSKPFTDHRVQKISLCCVYLSKSVTMVFFIPLFFLTIMSTIVNETANFKKKRSFYGKTIVFEKKIHATLLNVVLHEVKQLWGS